MIKNNISKMYLLKAVTWFMVAMPIIVLFFKEHNLTLFEVMILQAVYSVSVALFEIPSGYIADVFGRKNTIILSTIFSFLGFMIFSNYSYFYVFIFAEILVGIGGSLMSGADSALIYDTLIENNLEESYNKIEGRNYAIGNFSESIAGVLGGVLATFSIFLPVYVQTFILFFSIPIAFSLIEPNTYYLRREKNSLISIIKTVRLTLIENRRLRWLIIFSSSIGLGTLSIAWFAQPFFKDINIDLVYFGVLWATLNFSAGITSYFSHYFRRKNNSMLYIFLTICLALSFIMIGHLNSLISLLFIYLIYFIRGVLTPILKTEINIHSSSRRRATILSIRSFIIRISFAICAPILAFTTEFYTLSIVFYFLAFIVGFFSLLSCYKLSKLD